MTRANVWLFGSICACALVACVTNHAALEKKPSVPGGGAAGAGGSAGRAPVGGGGNGGNGGTAGHSDYEPPGDSALTVVNGIEDAPSVLVCFAKSADGADPKPFGHPLGGDALTFGAGLAVATVPGLAAASEALEPIVIAGDLEQLNGLDCAHAVALATSVEASLSGEPGAGGAGGEAGVSGNGASGAPIALADSVADAGAAGAAANAPKSSLRVRALPIIPAGTLNAGQSYLLVFDGCMGGSGFTAFDAEKYCGAGFSSFQPTLSSVFVPLSRKMTDLYVGMQVVQASRATGAVDIYSRSSLPGANLGITIATGVVPGQLAPRPALVGHASSEYTGDPAESVQAWADGVSLLTDPWTDVLARGGLSDLSDGSTYALVLVGPRANLGPSKATFWNQPAFTIVPTSPSF